MSLPPEGETAPVGARRNGKTAKAGERSGARDRRGAWTVVAVHALFVSGVGLSTTFVNVYLWQHGGGLGVVLHYHVALFLALMPGGVAAGLVAARTDRVVALRWGVALHAAFFLAVLLLGTRAPWFAWPLGAVMGLGMGFYYVAASILVLEFTYGQSASGLVGAMDRARLAAATLAPFLAAFVIDQLARPHGYRLVFAASFVLFVAAALVSQRLARAAAHRPLSLGPTLFRPSAAWRRFMGAQGLRGVRDGVFLFLAGILVYERVHSEWELGLFALGSGALSWIATWWVAARANRGPARDRLMGVGVCTSVASALALAAWPGKAGVIAFGVLEALAVPLVAVPFSAESYALVGRDPAGRRRGAGYMVAREIPLNLGRLAGVSVLLVVVDVLGWRGGLGVVLVGLAVANVVAWWTLRPSFRSVHA